MTPCRVAAHAGLCLDIDVMGEHSLTGVRGVTRAFMRVSSACTLSVYRRRSNTCVFCWRCPAQGDFRRNSNAYADYGDPLPFVFFLPARHHWRSAGNNTFHIWYYSGKISPQTTHVCFHQPEPYMLYLALNRLDSFVYCTFSNLLVTLAVVATSPTPICDFHGYGKIANGWVHF